MIQWIIFCKNTRILCHNKCTKWFDTISRTTVKAKYNRAGKSLNELDFQIEEYTKKLSSEKQSKIKNKLSEIGNARKYFNEENVFDRLDNQGSLMENLEKEIQI